MVHLLLTGYLYHLPPPFPIPRADHQEPPSLAVTQQTSTRIAVATPREWVFALIFFYNGSKILLHPCCGMFYLELPLYMPVSNSSL